MGVQRRRRKLLGRSTSLVTTGYDRSACQKALSRMHTSHAPRFATPDWRVAPSSGSQTSLVHIRGPLSHVFRESAFRRLPPFSQGPSAPHTTSCVVGTTGLSWEEIKTRDRTCTDASLPYLFGEREDNMFSHHYGRETVSII
jgi:hypothetical protein